MGRLISESLPTEGALILGYFSRRLSVERNDFAVKLSSLLEPSPKGGGGNGRSSDYPFDRLVSALWPSRKQHNQMNNQMYVQSSGVHLRASLLHALASTCHAIERTCLRRVCLHAYCTTPSLTRLVVISLTITNNHISRIVHRNTTDRTRTSFEAD